MRSWFVATTRVALALALMSCSGTDLTGPDAKASPEPAVRTTVAATETPPRISEIHYDNSGTDAGEAIEVSMPVGADASQYKIVLYNGSGGALYGTPVVLSSLTPVTCGAGLRKIVVVTYPSNGIQNGGPDGIALIGPGATVVELLSYEGTFTAVGGDANGLTSTDIGVSENGSESASPVTSLKRDGLGQWSGPTPNNFGVCNDEDIVAEPVETVSVSPTATTIVEGATASFTAQAFDANGDIVPGTAFTWTSSDETVATVNASGVATGVSAGSASITATTENGKFATAALTVDEPPPDLSGPVFISEIHYDDDGADTNERIEIEGPAGLNMGGWTIVLYNGNGGTSYATINLTGVIPASCDTRGVLTFAASGIQNGSPDGIALVKPDASVAEFVSYEGVMTATNGPAAGLLSADIGVTESDNGPDTRSLQRFEGEWYGPAAGSPAACNPPPPPPTITFSGRDLSDPALPVGFQDQIFATLLDQNSNEVVTDYTWTSETPAIASVDPDGVLTALAAGTAILRATATVGGTTATYSLPTVVATFGGATYPGNAEFGEPADSDPTDDFILRHTTFTSSFSSVRGTPNWVSYNLDASHIGTQDRCDCFTYDPALPATYTRYTTADYTGAGTFHGYGIDRGHLARSFDRTTGNLDNAYTFYFSNIIPQAADNNQGPWAALESHLGNLAVSQNKEVYVVAGVAGNKGTVKNEGLIVIPEHTWKVAVIMPRDQGLANVDDLSDVQVIAVIMPNVAGIRNVNWQTYVTTVDAVEALSGYNLLDLLSDPVEIAVESNTASPVAGIDGPYTALEHESVAMSAASSSDPDAGDVLTYQWDFGDGTSAAGVSQSHVYTVAGTYNVRLIVSDQRTLADTIFTTATIHSPKQGTQQAIALVQQMLADGDLSSGQATSLRAKLESAIRSFDRGQDAVAISQLRSLISELDDLVATGVLSESDAAPLRTLVTRVIASASL